MMKRVMRESAMDLTEAQISTRNSQADRLIEKWSKKKGLDLDGGKFEAIFEASPIKARNLAIILENNEKYFRTLTETQISDTFNTTPQTVTKVIRLGYPNSVVGDIFVDYAMSTMKDTMYKLEPAYAKAKRGASVGDVMYESDADRPATEIEEESVTTTATATFTGTLTTNPLRPWHVRVYLAGAQVAQDDGNGFLVGSTLSTVTASTINYTTGAYSLVFAANATAGLELLFQYSYNSEDSTLYGEQMDVKFNLVPYDLRATPKPIGFSWSHMTELLMDSALHVDAEEALITAGADELKKSRDFRALKLAYRGSKWSSAVEFNTDWASAGSDSDYAHTQSVLKYIENAGNKTFDALQRGDVSHLVAGPKAVAYVKNHKLFVPDNSMPSVGVYKVGTLDGKPLYKSPIEVVPTDEILTIYRNNRENSNDAAITLGTYLPFYRTQTLEFNSFHKETAMATYDDLLLQERKYLNRVKLLGL